MACQSIARDLLIQQAQLAKQQLINELESGRRNYDVMRLYLDKYTQYLIAADILGAEGA